MGLILKKYHFLGLDYMVYDLLENGVNLNQAQIQLLCDRDQGIGADKFLLCTGTTAKLQFQLFAADGTAGRCEEPAKMVFLRYLQEASYELNQIEPQKRRRKRQEFIDRSEALGGAYGSEIRLTEAFQKKMSGKAAGQIAACAS